MDLSRLLLDAMECVGEVKICTPPPSLFYNAYLLFIILKYWALEILQLRPFPHAIVMYIVYLCAYMILIGHKDGLVHAAL